MSREDTERGGGVKSRGNASNSYLSSTSTYPIEDTEAHYWTSWLVPMFVVANVAVFIVVMCINNCPKHLHTRLEGKCVARFLGRFSFEPLKDNPLFGPSSATYVIHFLWFTFWSLYTFFLFLLLPFLFLFVSCHFTLINTKCWWWFKFLYEWAF